jgi:PAS domain S-box-containing protein/diguanylate cyclase (GGDEF)-like protein
MKCVNLRYQGPDDLIAAIDQNQLAKEANLLIQVFDGSGDEILIQTILQTLSRNLPQAVIIGASTAGEILGDQIHEKSVLISFAAFEQTKLVPIVHPECDEESGTAIAALLQSDRIKAAILFSEGIASEPEAMLDALSQKRPDLIVAGGAAADGGRFEKTALIFGDQVRYEGVVGVGFDNPSLIAGQGARLGYLPLGRSMTVTKAQGHQLLELDHQPIRSVIAHYLGDHVLSNLPASIVQFPLLKEADQTPIARAPVAALEDGSLVYAGHLNEGDRVHFAIAGSELSGDTPVAAWSALEAQPIEAIWIYSCMGRRAFLNDILEREFAALGAGRPVSGFFTYGEFFQNGAHHDMLNLTTTALTLSEGAHRPKAIEADKHSAPALGDSTLRTLSHLVATVSHELQEAIGSLDAYRLANDEISLISCTDTDGTITHVNEAFCKASGYRREELIGQNHRIVRHPDVEPAIYAQMWQSITRGKIWRGLLPNRARDGQPYYVDMAIVPIRDGEGHIREYIAVRHDVTRLIAQERRIAEQSTDPLTRLPNRNAFFDRLNQTQKPLIALLNVDRFRDINSFYGFKAGDTLLCELTAALQAYCGGELTLFRVGGDLFALLGDGIALEALQKRVEAILHTIAQTPFLEQSFGASIRLTAGIAEGSWQVLSRAEAALNRAQERRSELAIAHADDDRTTESNLKMIGILRQAVTQPWWVIPYFQPIARASDGVVVKYEALMRLRDQDGTIHSPFSFLELAKRSRYYPNLTHAMIESSLQQFSTRTEGLTLNLSVEDIQNDETMAFLYGAISEFRDPERLTLEVTESEMIEDYESVIAAITRMKRLGASIAIDDFGSGYSNFAYLTRLKADYLKIDGSIVREIVHNEDAYHTLCAIVDLARRFKMQTVAEFISSKEVALKAKEAGVDYWQGFYVDKPAPLPN